MPLALIAIGIPGSGKTTLLKEFAREYGLVYINKDEIREELLGDVEDQSKNRDIWIESQKRTEDALRDGTSVALDSTYVERWKRKELVTFLRRAGASRIIALYFDIPFDLAIARNEKRERIVSLETIAWMQKQLEKAPPSMLEGYDVLYTLKDAEHVRDELNALCEI